VLAVIAYGIERNMSVADSCKLACYAAARTVEKRGVVTITINDLKPTTVWTNGVFDILHEGHFKLLKFAKSKGKKLVVGINSDASTKRLKGETRPINNQLQRKMNLELLPWVDEVVIFDEDTPINVIKKFNPDLIIKGGDYTVETTVGNEVCPVEIFPIIKGHSTTNIIEKIK
jgi:D-beta-D-heptose 7-phosphate kinase/D-beta-D-heptose 1-phosphate adenosyltransferase